MTLGQKLNKLRIAKGISLELLSLELDISKTAIRKWEIDESKPNIDSLLKVCDYYEVDVYSLFDDVSNVNFSHAQFKGENYVVNPNNSTITFNNSPELLKLIVENQNRINELVKEQTKLLDDLRKK